MKVIDKALEKGNVKSVKVKVKFKDVKKKCVEKAKKGRKEKYEA